MLGLGLSLQKPCSLASQQPLYLSLVTAKVSSPELGPGSLWTVSLGSWLKNGCSALWRECIGCSVPQDVGIREVHLLWL